MGGGDPAAAPCPSRSGAGLNGSTDVVRTTLFKCASAYSALRQSQPLPAGGRSAGLRCQRAWGSAASHCGQL